MLRIPLARLALPFLFASLSPFAAHTATAAPDTNVETAVTRQLERYEQALNASDVDAVMKLYARDPVFMPQHSLPAVGREAVRAAYRQVFAKIRLDIDFSIDEIRPLGPDWAFARTRSNGTVKVLGVDASRRRRDQPGGVPPAPRKRRPMALRALHLQHYQPSPAALRPGLAGNGCDTPAGQRRHRPSWYTGASGAGLRSAPVAASREQEER